jgi:hypothetical protein
MSIIFSNNSNSKRIREPLFQVGRSVYRGTRKSELENLETNFLELDLTRILSELENIDISILGKLTYVIGDINDVTTEVSLNDGLSYEIPGVTIFIDKDGAVEENLEVDIMNKMSSKLSRLLNKVQRLENGN